MNDSAIPTVFEVYFLNTHVLIYIYSPGSGMHHNDLVTPTKCFSKVNVIWPVYTNHLPASTWRADLHSKLKTKYSGTSVLINSFRNLWWVLKPTSTELLMRLTHWPLFHRERGALRCEQAPSAKTFFSHQNAMSTGFDGFWNQQVPRYDCNLDSQRGGKTLWKEYVFGDQTDRAKALFQPITK